MASTAQQKVPSDGAGARRGFLRRRSGGSTAVGAGPRAAGPRAAGGRAAAAKGGPATPTAPKVTFRDRGRKLRDRGRQIVAAFRFTRKHDRLLVPLLLVAFAVPLLVAVGIAAATGAWWSVLPFGVLAAVLAVLVVFGRRAATATYAEVEGQPGAAVAVLQNMRGDWRITPVVAVNTAQDMVHRVVGRPGIVLVAEGAPSRVGPLIGQEKKRIARVAGGIEVYDVVVGNDEGQVTLRKLQSHFVKLPKNITPKQVNAVEKRLQALGAARPPMPKGPLPKGARLPKGMKAPRSR